MAAGFDVELVAEGVETLDQARWLRHLGITLVQGYAFGRPVPVSATAALLRDGLPLDRLAAGFSTLDPGLAEPVTAHPSAPAGEPAMSLGEAADGARALDEHAAAVGGRRPHQGAPHERRSPPLRDP